MYYVLITPAQHVSQGDFYMQFIGEFGGAYGIAQVCGSKSCTFQALYSLMQERARTVMFALAAPVSASYW